MDFQKKLVLPDHLLSPRKKAVSRYGLWISAPFILLSVVLLSNSLKGRVVAPLFQGFNTVGVNSSLTSWPFPFSTSYFSPPFNNNATSGTISKVHGGGDSAPKSPEAAVVAVVLGKTHLDDFSGKDKNGTLQDTQGSNGGNVSDSSSGKRVLDSSHLVNSSVVVKNASLHGEEGLVIIRNFSFSGSTQGKSMENSMNVNYTTSQNNNGELGGSSPAAAGQEREDQDKISYEKCDLFDGKWIKDDSKPYYPEGSCPHIDWDFDCHLNGRPDGGFVKWKWQPNGCNIPSLNATDFLERLRGKKLVFVGDSLNRNMWESLVCILRHSIKNKKSVYEISGRTEFKKKGFYAFIFEDYNCTVDFVGSPFLVRESTFNGKNGAIETLRLDLMDKTTSMYQDADIIVFNTGHWWTHEKTSKGEDYYQEGNHVYPRLKVLEAYKRALMTWARWVDKNIDGNRTQVFFRGYSVTHFKGGQWNSGGQCHKETEPIFNEAYLAKYPSKMRALEHVLPQMKTPVTYLNISRLTDYRKDGHPSIYRMQYKTAEERIAAERAQDCSHWCLPGVPDTWNELLYASLLNLGWGSWRI